MLAIFQNTFEKFRPEIRNVQQHTHNLNRTIPLAIFLGFLLVPPKIMAQTKTDLSATASSTAAPDAAQNEANNLRGVPAACDTLDDKAPPGAHTVKLSWNASIAASTSLADTVIGYIVYRSTKPDDLKAMPINIRRLTDTACIDVHVSPGEVYYYFIRAVNASGAISARSNEVRVEIPPEGPLRHNENTNSSPHN
jgi:hypothetical protein